MILQHSGGGDGWEFDFRRDERSHAAGLLVDFAAFRMLPLAFGSVGLVFVSLENPHHHWSEFFLQLRASRRVLKFDAFSFAANQTSFPKNPEMLRQRGLGKLQVAFGQKGRTVHGTVSLGQFRIDANADRVGEGIQNALHGYFIQRRVIKWPHKKILSQFDKIVQWFNVTEQ